MAAQSLGWALWGEYSVEMVLMAFDLQATANFPVAEGLAANIGGMGIAATEWREMMKRNGD